MTGYVRLPESKKRDMMPMTIIRFMATRMMSIREDLIYKIQATKENETLSRRRKFALKY